MSEAFQRERLQPSLLDRLIDDSPGRPVHNFMRGLAPSSPEDDESSSPVVQAEYGTFVISARRLRECVRRDLFWLLNTVNLEPVNELTDFPNVANSVLNYGTPELTGTLVSNMDPARLEKELRRIVLIFEPRILPETLKIKVLKRDEMDRRAIGFEIECDIWGQPAPEHLFLQSNLDIESGAIEFRGNMGA